MLTRDDQKNEVFKIAKQMTKTNQDIIGEKCVKDDAGELAFDDKSKKAAWKSYYNKLLNTEFDLNEIVIVCQQLIQLLVQP